MSKKCHLKLKLSRKREAQHLVAYPNGAVAPYDPNVAAATAEHYAAKAAAGVYPYAGAAVVHPPAAALHPVALGAATYVLH